MAKPITVTIDPPKGDWSLGDPGKRSIEDRRALLVKVKDRSAGWGLPKWREFAQGPDALPRVIVTGHQAMPWHPGILAKDFAALAAAEQHGAAPLHLVVDQDAHPVWEIDVPRVQAGRVEIERHRLSGELAGVPTGFQPPVDAQRLADWLGGLGLSVPGEPGGLDGKRTLAEQVAVVLNHWRGGVDARLPIFFTSDLVQSDTFAQVVSAMRGDAPRAIRAYNHAVYAVPQAGLRPLAVTREWVELPLWACRWEQPRQRVYADISDRRTILIDASGERVRHGEDGVTLMPRALLLTVLMRIVFCDFFIHGKGGGVYDRATEQWWRSWRGEELAPMATVSADVYLDLDVPTATKGDVQRAVWFAHHLPVNVDRFAEVDPALASEKRHLIEHMDDDRDKRRRARAFRRICAINESLVAQHADHLAEADQAVHTARTGLSNAAALDRRDWCFALYPAELLAALRERVGILPGLTTET